MPEILWLFCQNFVLFILIIGSGNIEALYELCDEVREFNEKLVFEFGASYQEIFKRSAGLHRYGLNVGIYFN